MVKHQKSIKRLWPWLELLNDHYSKFVKLYAVKDRSANTAAKYVADYFLDYGVPLKPLSDQDPSYEHELFLRF